MRWLLSGKRWEPISILPQAHTLISRFQCHRRISAPALLFKSEAIVHPDDVIKYIDPAECQLSYNPLLMALLWNSLATRKVDLLYQALNTRFKIHPKTAWVNYVRCHDDIGWTFSDEDASRLGVNGTDHRRFLKRILPRTIFRKFCTRSTISRKPKNRRLPHFRKLRITGRLGKSHQRRGTKRNRASDPPDIAFARYHLNV